MKVKVLQAAGVDITVEKLLLPFVDALIRSNYHVDICCAEGKYSRNLQEQGYNIIHIPFKRQLFTLSHLKTFYALYVLFRANKYDIVHFHTELFGAIGRIAAKCARCNVIVHTTHGSYSHEYMNTLLRRILVLIEKALARWTTDWLFLVSEEDACLARDRKFLRKLDHIIWISNGVMLDRFLKEYPAEKIKGDLGIDKFEKVIGFVGRVVAEKGIVELVDAFTQIRMVCPNAKLLIVGDTLDSDRDTEAKKQLLRKIKAEDLENDVVFTGLRDDVPELLSAMDVFVLPSYREGMPTTIIEAMASGKPVVATRIRGCREEVIDGKTGLLVDVRDSGSLVESVLRIIMNDDMAISMGEKGRKRAISLFNFEQVIAKQLEVFDLICRDLSGCSDCATSES